MQRNDLARALRIAVMRGLGMTKAQIESELWRAGLDGSVASVKASERLVARALESR